MAPFSTRDLIVLEVANTAVISFGHFWICGRDCVCYIIRRRLALFLAMLSGKRPRAGYQSSIVHTVTIKLMSTELLKELVNRRLYWDADAKVWHCDADWERVLWSEAIIEDLFSCHDTSGTNEGEVEGGLHMNIYGPKRLSFKYTLTVLSDDFFPSTYKEYIYKWKQNFNEGANRKVPYVLIY